MKLRLLSLAVVALAACGDSGSQDPLSGLPSGSPRYEAAPQNSNQTAPSRLLQPCAATRAAPLGVCSRVERELRAGDEEALGFAAEAFTQLISGERRSEVLWTIDATGSNQRSELVLTLAPQGPVRFVEQSLASAGFAETYTFGNTGAQYFRCGDRLVVDAQLTLSTPDGSLNESVAASVEAESADYARVSVQLPASEIVGSLRAAAQQRGADALGLALGISELGTGLEGSLGLSSSRSSDDAALGDSCSPLGSLSLAPGCPLGSFPLSGGDELRGLSFAGALARLNATSPAALSDDGSALSLAFTAAPEQQCLSVDTPARLPAALMFPGTVQLISSDGRVGGSLQVQLQAEALNGELQRVTAQTQYLVPDSRGLPELASSYAILEPLVWSELELGGFEFQVEARPDASGGLLRALGGNLSCSGTRPCEQVCPGEGCTMTTAEKWAVRWGDVVLGSNLPPQTPRD